MNNHISFVGNLCADPEVKSGQKGNRTIFRVAVNEGRDDNVKTHFVNCTAFDTLGENIAASLKKGQRIFVRGVLSSYDKQVTIDGKDVTLQMLGVTAYDAGPDLRWATAEPQKVQGGGSAKKTSAPAPADDDF